MTPSLAVEADARLLLDAVRRFASERAARRSARAALDAGVDGLPPFWGELVDLGWLGLAVPEAAGGQGAGFAEQAVVLEQLGRTVTPGPVLPTVWAAAVLGLATADAGRRRRRCDGDADLRATLAAVASGTPATVALSADLTVDGPAMVRPG